MYLGTVSFGQNPKPLSTPFSLDTEGEVSRTSR
eukprot:COSAG02_NODE_17349_length_1010_cov_1.306257_1_plen_32_part_10